MVTQKKGVARVSEDSDVLVAHVPLQAILLADSFATKFRSITLERPKVLLPLANVPMINYTLAWLESAGVEEVFVFCCAHSKQVIGYLKSNQFSHPKFLVTTIESHNSVSVGDALRVIYERNVIHGDFVLIAGDTISNMSLTSVLQEHKERKKKDSNAVMTMVVKKSKPSAVINQSRLGTDELFMAIDPTTKQLLYYEEKTEYSKGALLLDKTLLADNLSLTVHNDKQDCYIDICSPEVLSLFTDNFDYQHLRRDFVKGLLVDDIMGYKIYTHEINSSYAARIDNFRSYATITKDIIQRWTYPLVLDKMFSGNCATKLERRGIYRASDIQQSRSAEIGPFAVIGNGTRIGNYTRISNSVIGNRCTIGSNVVIEGSHVWDNVTIEDGCKLEHAIVCDGVVLKSGAVVGPGAVLSFNVVIGQQFTVPAYSKVSLLKQPTEEDSDEELEYAVSSGASAETSMDMLNGGMTSDSSQSQHRNASEVGSGGAGYIWSIRDGGHEEEWRHSVAPIPADKLAEAMLTADDDLTFLAQGPDSLSPLGDTETGCNSSDSEDGNNEESDSFEKEVEATFFRGVSENVAVDLVVLEVKNLRTTFNMAFSDCAGAVFYSMMKLALETPHTSAGKLLKNVLHVIKEWNKLLKCFLRGIDEEIEVILKFEEMCSESARVLFPLFTQILEILYDETLLQEHAILKWADEKQEADESDKVFVKQSETFIRWLREAPEEEDEEDE